LGTHQFALVGYSFWRFPRLRAAESVFVFAVSGMKKRLGEIEKG
jgi:hypothetical protein